MKYLSCIFLGLIFISCDSSRIYEDFNDLEEAYWHMDSVQQFSFEITDTIKLYNLYATFRNASSYPYYNIYFQYSLKDSTRMIKEELLEYNFFDEKTGEPKGSGLGDLFDHKFPLEENFQFDDPGNYTISLKQQMRLDTLPFILSVGARVESIEESN